MSEHKVAIRLDKSWEDTGLFNRLDMQMDKQGDFYVASMNQEYLSGILDRINSYSNERHLNTFLKIDLFHVPIPLPEPLPEQSTPPGKSKCPRCNGDGYV